MLEWLELLVQMDEEHGNASPDARLRWFILKDVTDNLETNHGVYTIP